MGNVEMFAWLKELLESIAENDTEKLEATLAVKPYSLYVADENMPFGRIAEVAALFKDVDVKILKAILIKYINGFGEYFDFTYWCVKSGGLSWKFTKVQMYLDARADVEKHIKSSCLLSDKEEYEIACEEANKRLDIELHELYEKEKESYYKLVRRLVFGTIAAAEEAHKNDKWSAYHAALVFSRITDVWSKKTFEIKKNTMSRTKLNASLKRMLKAHERDIPYGFEGMSNAFF